MIRSSKSEALEAVTYRRLPRWRGFNLVEKCVLQNDRPYSKQDFDLVAEWGFDFVRLPTDYRIWTNSPGNYRDEPLREIDQAVQWGRERQIHVNLCIHRAPGHCVNQNPDELPELWGDGESSEEMRRQFAAQWRMFAERYRGIPSAELSFDLVNEPVEIPVTRYVRAVRVAVEAIREVDRDRLVIADGLKWGRKPVPELIPLEIAQSTRGYMPFPLTHYRAGWVEDSDSFPIPTWPATPSYDARTLWDRQVEPWRRLAEHVGVHVGEWGAFRHTPHTVVLAWMKDCLANWRRAGFGWALWNLRGDFGVLDSNRSDVAYEQCQGHKLDRQMLELLKSDIGS